MWLIHVKKKKKQKATNYRGAKSTEDERFRCGAGGGTGGKVKNKGGGCKEEGWKWIGGQDSLS